MFEEIDNFCDDIGCTRNDWIKDTLKDKLRTQNDEPLEINYNDLEKVRPVAEGIVKRISYDDGKTWSDVSELTNVTVSD